MSSRCPPTAAACSGAKLSSHQSHVTIHIIIQLALLQELENVAIANALQLEAAQRHTVPISYNTLRVPSLKWLSLSAAVLERFSC